jgi:3-deoxy-D-manno-octulosonate 8-phosphate phosphatase (KDO 8-P phosphatase)
MTFLEQNIKGLSARFGVDFYQLLSDFNVDSVYELAIGDLEALAQEYEVDLYALLFKPIVVFDHLKSKLSKIKLVILDVDGVLSDAGMYYTESGDQIKKYNAKDGMAILEGQKAGKMFGIISSAYTSQMVVNRAETLKIERVYVGRESKISILKKWCSELNLDLSEVAMIGDDVNDLSIMTEVGFRACPSDAVQVVKKIVDVVLSTKGGNGCVREFVDNFLLNEPIGSFESDKI